MKRSVVLPACNEEHNLLRTLDAVLAVLRREAIPFEVVVVNDNRHDDTRPLVLDRLPCDTELVLVDNRPPRGFGGAVRTGWRSRTQPAAPEIVASGASVTRLSDDTVSRNA